MRVKEFVSKYEKQNDDKSRESYFKKNIKVKEYIPYTMKMTLAQNLVNVTMFDGETKKYRPNSSAYYLMYNRCIIEAYTNLEIDTDKWVDDYDLLDSSGVLYKIILEKIPERELTEFRMVCDMTADDAKERVMEPSNFVSDQVERVSTILGASLNPVLDKLADSLNNLDDGQIEKLGKILEKGFKVVRK